MYTFHDPMPDCVPEHYRSHQEDADHRYGLQMQRQEIYQANRRKLDAATASGLPVMDFGGYGPCWDCPDVDHDTMTDEDDDMCRVICWNPACPHHNAKEVSQ